MLAPPAGYIPRHYRGTPLKGDAAAVTLVIYSLADTNGLQLRVPSSEGYGVAGGYVYENKYRKSIYVKGLLIFVLAPPAGYIPRHCRGTPLKMGRCRRDDCLVKWIPHSAAVSPETTFIAPTQPL